MRFVSFICRNNLIFKILSNTSYWFTSYLFCLDPHKISVCSFSYWIDCDSSSVHSKKKFLLSLFHVIYFCYIMCYLLTNDRVINGPLISKLVFWYVNAFLKNMYPFYHNTASSKVDWNLCVINYKLGWQERCLPLQFRRSSTKFDYKLRSADCEYLHDIPMLKWHNVQGFTNRLHILRLKVSFVLK